MPDYVSHIILLPQGAGWEWYEAVRTYVEKYRVTVTQSADDAGSFHGLSHTITVVDTPGGWPGDIVVWLQQNYPDAQRDIIRVSRPAELARLLTERAEADDRYGARQMILSWPLPQEVIVSQRFAARPWVYRRWQFPGHEGMDFAAPVGTPVLACADGRVYFVDTDHPADPDRYPYGHQVRIEHTTGEGAYRTYYAHLSAVHVRKDQQVHRGQTIGLSGDTGNVDGPHLHLALKLRGSQPSDRPGFADPYNSAETYLDPEFYLIRPDGRRLWPSVSLPTIYGVHEDQNAEAAHLMRDQGVQGYILWTEGLLHGPDGGRNYAASTTEHGHIAIARLNHGYEPNGTIPHSSRHAEFAHRCVNWVSHSSGCRIWIIGNEPNNPREHPPGEAITAQRYARCFNQVYRAIKEVQPESTVALAAIDPTNAAMGDCRQYFWDVLANVEAVDGIALHAYTHGPDPQLIIDPMRFDRPPLTWQFYHFRMFETFMEAIPESLRHLPVYLTETNHLYRTGEGDWGWVNQNKGWVWAMYQRVDEWNRRGGQQILCALLYRYPQIDPWAIGDKDQVIEDFRQAMGLGYRPYVRSQ